MPRKLTREIFIERARQLYGNKYNYSKVVYVNIDTKVCITCPDHGDFWVTPHNFLNNHVCPTCSGRQRITKEVFIERSCLKHNDRYDYSKVVYHGLNVPVRIICPIHGEFLQMPSGHMNGNGCPKCFGSPKSTTEEFVMKARSKYGDLYDYSNVRYVNSKEKVCIICPKHGEFWMTPNSHLRGHRCPKCFGTPKKTLEQFIEEARKIHGDKFDYNKVVYDGEDVKVCIICPEHGEFWQKPGIHLRGYGCPICGGSKRLTNEEFIKKAKLVHEDKYDYSKVNYINTSTKVCIICPEHGEFWQTPNNHLFGAGCPTCPESNMEGEVRHLLIANNIVFEQEKGFDWLVYHRRMFLDFFLPEYGVAIECQGGQHFFPSQLFGGEDFYKLTIERDAAKKRLCEEHGIRLLYYSNAYVDYPYPVFESLRLLLKAIKDKGIVADSKKWRDLQLTFDFED